MKKADIGLIGLAVMGENLVMNMASKGFTVSVYNRTTEKVDRFIEGRAKGMSIIGTKSLEDFVGSLEKPRKIMMMVKAGKPVDILIDSLMPYLDKGDIIVDGGNSHFPDTIRRTEYLESKGFYFIGMGVSGGEEGALNGPSLMPGGSDQAWEVIKSIFTAISAKVDGDACCRWMGADGAGHFVKMVHNGIEYGDMQIIGEAYHMMRTLLGMDAKAMYDVFDEWNNSELYSYLVEITRDIMAVEDDDGSPLLDKILDTAGQKGTGKWAAVASLDEAIPLTLITQAVYARGLSAMKEERVKASSVLDGPKTTFTGDKGAFLKALKATVYAAKIISYAQGFALLRAAAKSNGWSLNYGDIALIWRGGCIIRSVFLNDIKKAYDRDPQLENLLLDSFFKQKVEQAQDSFRTVVSEAVKNGIAVPTLTAALSYFDGYRSDWLPANLLQAQRDYFGAHTYERVDKPRGEFFHTNWTGKGGNTSASTYDA